MSEHPSLGNISPVWSRSWTIVAERGEGACLYSTDGREFLDFTTGIGVTNTGHCHPKVVKAVQEQAAKLLHGQANIVLHQPMLDLIGELKSILPPSLDGFFFSNSGAEAVEGAMKLARMATGRTNMVVFQGSFHGRTVGTMSLTTSKTIYRGGYQPLMPGVFVAPFPYSLRYGWSEEETSRWCLSELEYLLTSQTAPEETAAFLIEPVLGEGGYIAPPKSFLQGLRKLADQHGILLIADEIQSGFGRTGKWFAFEHYDFVPDILIVAKGLASGLPLSGVIASKALMQKWTPGSHGGTYGGNAVSSAAAVATVRAIRDEGMLGNATARGKQLMDGLKALAKKHEKIAEVRGLGLMVGVEFRDADGKPDKAAAKSAVKGCYERSLLLLTCGAWDSVIRFIPPLIVTEEQIDHSLSLFEAALKDEHH
ncbi:MAG: aminotransferase class III-fold pyridoxal phosphate-dependent enzyme [Anaerolineae bacterium]|nr:MAG: aminotransferase class III-fold pyridoxal phosphate-dependent enzyme [Anaerolineae bacterium]